MLGIQGMVPLPEVFGAFGRASAQLWHNAVALFGPETAHWDRLGRMANPVGYLFRIAQNRARRSLRRREPPPTIPTVSHEVTIEPALTDGLQALSERQRVVVGLIHGYGWSFAEVGDLLGIAKSSVQRHEERGMAALRKHLGVLT